MILPITFSNADAQRLPGLLGDTDAAREMRERIRAEYRARTAERAPVALPGQWVDQ